MRRAPDVTHRELIVVMGVSGCGKTTVGRALARALGLPFLEGDALHDARSIAKMSRGKPLDDEDRAPWLDAIGRALGAASRYPEGLVVACSALKRAYRDRLRAVAGGVRFVFLEAPQPLIERRVAARHHPFMPQSLVASQFRTLEPPAAPETDTVTVDASASVAAAARAAVRALRSPADRSRRRRR